THFVDGVLTSFWLRGATVWFYKRCHYARPGRCDAPNIYRGFGHGDLTISVAVRTDLYTKGVYVAEAFQPSRSGLSPASSVLQTLLETHRAPPPAIQTGLARDTRRVQLGVTRGEGVVIGDIDVHYSGTQVDSAVVWMGVFIESHQRSPVGQAVEPVIRLDHNSSRVSLRASGQL
ncbi:MAG: hypothetical protein JWN70_6980, partial [Planctomycetaceae bacterium]|nr:hypothetical protein [Planctomycetaceae bacterium]